MSLSKEKNYLLYLLAKQDYSRKQLFDKFTSRAHISPEQIIALLDEFEKNKWLSDERFARVFVNSEVSKLRGRKRIYNTAVYQKGLDEDLVIKFLNDEEIDWFENCLRCYIKKYKNPSLDLNKDLKLKQKVVNYLVYNGYSYDEINYAINAQCE